MLPRNALHSLTARRHQRSTTRECSCADQSSHYKTYTCMCGHDIQQSTNQLRKAANPVYDQMNRGKFPCPRSRLRIWFRETGLAVPSLISLLILYTNAESGAYSRYSSRIPGRRPYIFTSTTHHRVSPEFIGSRNCVPMAFIAESPLAQGQ